MIILTITLMVSFHRRPLPAPAIAFGSDEGLRLFEEALAASTMGSYFRLAEQFHTQAEPAFCGLASLVMVLNALAVDPQRQWKGVWRWYSESLLECCEPLAVVKERGITLGKLACTARCNSLDVDVVVADRDITQAFRDTVRRVCSQPAHSASEFVVAAYSRRGLEQTGEGHFSPIAGYHAATDRVLIMDTARFKYPPHWVPVDALAACMREFDKETNKPRGFMALRRRPLDHLRSPVFQLAFLDHAQFVASRRSPCPLQEALATPRDTRASPADAARLLDDLADCGALPTATVDTLSCCAALNCDEVNEALAAAADALGIKDKTTYKIFDARQAAATMLAVPPAFWKQLFPDDVAAAEDLAAAVSAAFPDILAKEAADLRRKFQLYVDFHLGD